MKTIWLGLVLFFLENPLPNFATNSFQNQFVNLIKENGEEFITKELEEFETQAKQKESLIDFYGKLSNYLEEVQYRNQVFDHIITGVEDSLVKIVNIINKHHMVTENTKPSLNENFVIQLKIITDAIKPWTHRVLDNMLDFANKWVEKRIPILRENDLISDMDQLSYIREDLINARTSVSIISQLFLKQIKDINKYCYKFMDWEGIRTEMERRLEKSDSLKENGLEKEVIKSIKKEIEVEILDCLDRLKQIVYDKTFISRTNEAVNKTKKLSLNDVQQKEALELQNFIGSVKDGKPMDSSHYNQFKGLVTKAQETFKKFLVETQAVVSDLKAAITPYFTLRSEGKVNKIRCRVNQDKFLAARKALSDAMKWIEDRRGYVNEKDNKELKVMHQYLEVARNTLSVGDKVFQGLDTLKQVEASTFYDQDLFVKTINDINNAVDVAKTQPFFDKTNTVLEILDRLTPGFFQRIFFYD